jgi:hypothetical protein
LCAASAGQPQVEQLRSPFFVVRFHRRRHDQRFAHGDGTLIDFMVANRELADNCRICADAEYGAFNPLRYLARWVGKKFGKACDLLGLPAYLQAIEETKQNKTNNTNKEK